MPYFSVMLEGQGIKIPTSSPDGTEEGPPAAGFYATRMVHAGSEAEAAEKVKAAVIREWSKPGWVQANKGGLPKLTVEKVTRLRFFSWLFAKPRRGHVFYPEDAESPESD